MKRKRTASSREDARLARMIRHERYEEFTIEEAGHIIAIAAALRGWMSTCEWRLERTRPKQ